MTIDPTRIDKGRLDQLRRDVAEKHGIDPYCRYTEREAACLLIRPDERANARADVSTLKRKRRACKIPYVPLGNSSVAYLGMVLCDFLMFGERSVLLWGGGDERSQQPVEADGATPPS